MFHYIRFGAFEIVLSEIIFVVFDDPFLLEKLPTHDIMVFD